MENWISNLPTTNEDDSKTRDYFQKNVKNCPKCHIPIEKSYGCDYVRCTNVACKTLFCFKFSRSGENNGQKESAGTSIASQPYLLMINKYLHQERSMNLEKKILKDVNLENYMEEEILQTLSKSRQTLMNTYVFSNFYISPIFENQVSNLEIVTDKLSYLVQSDLEQNLTQIKITSEETKKLRNDLSIHIEIGHRNNWWIVKEQPKMKFNRSHDHDYILCVLLCSFIASAIAFVILT